MYESYYKKFVSFINRVIDTILPKLLKYKHRKYLFLLIAVVLASLFIFFSLLLVRYDYLAVEGSGEIPVVYQRYGYNVEAESITNISIDWHRGDVKFIVSDTAENISVIELSEKRLLTNQRFDISSNENTLKIKWISSQIPINFLQNSEKRLQIIIPKNMAAALENIECKNFEGDITINQINSNNIDISSTLGSIKSDRVETSKAFFKTKNGDIVCTSSKSDDLVLSATTGNISVKALHSPKTEAKTSFGDIYLQGEFSDFLSVYSTSGYVRADLDQCPEKTELQSAHGDILLRLPKPAIDDGFELDYYKGRNSLNLPYKDLKLQDKKGVYTHGSGRYKLKLITTYGEINIGVNIKKEGTP